MGTLTPETLTQEETRDIVEGIYSLEAMGVTLLTEESVKPASDSDIKPHIDSAGRALYRILKRHPDMYKGITADLIDGAILLGAFSIPVLPPAINAWKKHKEKNKPKILAPPKENAPKAE